MHLVCRRISSEVVEFSDHGSCWWWRNVDVTMKGWGRENLEEHDTTVILQRSQSVSTILGNYWSCLPTEVRV